MGQGSCKGLSPRVRVCLPGLLQCVQALVQHTQPQHTPPHSLCIELRLLSVLLLLQLELHNALLRAAWTMQRAWQHATTRCTHALPACGCCSLVRVPAPLPTCSRTASSASYACSTTDGPACSWARAGEGHPTSTLTATRPARPALARACMGERGGAGRMLSRAACCARTVCKGCCCCCCRWWHAAAACGGTHAAAARKGWIHLRTSARPAHLLGRVLHWWWQHRHWRDAGGPVSARHEACGVGEGRDEEAIAGRTVLQQHPHGVRNSAAAWLGANVVVVVEVWEPLRAWPRGHRASARPALHLATAARLNHC